MMKVAAFCMWVLLVGVAFVSFNGFNNVVHGTAFVSGMNIAEVDAMTSEGMGRVLKEKMPHSIYDGEVHDGDVVLEDYHPFDPSPSSKASVKPGPIQHGTPLNPYIPTPSPSPPTPFDDDQPPQP